MDWCSNQVLVSSSISFPNRNLPNAIPAIFGLGGYTFKGIYRELQNHMGSTTQSYIIAARITQGHLDWDESTPEERQMIIDNYNAIKDDPEMYKLPSHLHQSTSSLMHKMHTHHSETDLPRKETPESHHSHHSVREAMHLGHKQNHSSPALDRDASLTTGSESSTLNEELHENHKHHHFHLHHKHAADKAAHTMSEVELPNEHAEIPIVKEAEIRQVMSM